MKMRFLWLFYHQQTDSLQQDYASNRQHEWSDSKRENSDRGTSKLPRKRYSREETNILIWRVMHRERIWASRFERHLHPANPDQLQKSKSGCFLPVFSHMASTIVPAPGSMATGSSRDETHLHQQPHPTGLAPDPDLPGGLQEEAARRGPLRQICNLDHISTESRNSSIS